ncbi:MAG: terminase small subunit [Firmicutes bacterium]|nr:terminase small subunit [Bacillota bacterium]
MVDNDELTDKQRIFCEEYLIDLNATQAAVRAGYSEKTAYSIGQENLNKPEIQEEIKRLKKARSKRTQITADRVLEELAKIGFANIKDYLKVKDMEYITGVDKEGKPITKKARGVEIFKTDNIEDDIAAAIAEIKQTKTGISLKLHDKIKALEDIGKHLDMFTNSIDLSINELPTINLVRGDKGGS